MRAFNPERGRGTPLLGCEMGETIAAVVNALAKPGVDLDGNGGVIPRPKGSC